MSYEADIDEVLSLLSDGRVDDAVRAMFNAYDRHGQEQRYLVYALDRIVRLVHHYHGLCEWKFASSSYEDALLSNRDSQGCPREGTALALFHLAYLKRFLGRNHDAILLLEALRSIETEYWTLPMGPEASWGACLVECYKDIGDTESADRVLRDYMEQHERLDRAELERRRRSDGTRFGPAERQAVLERALGSRSCEVILKVDSEPPNA
jgi:hypothetical protein